MKILTKEEEKEIERLEEEIDKRWYEIRILKDKIRAIDYNKIL